MMMSFGSKTLPRAKTTQLHTAAEGRSLPAAPVVRQNTNRLWSQRGDSRTNWLDALPVINVDRRHTTPDYTSNRSRSRLMGWSRLSVCLATIDPAARDELTRVLHTLSYVPIYLYFPAVLLACFSLVSGPLSSLLLRDICSRCERRWLS